MTIQGIAPTGKGPLGLPPAGKSKKAEGPDPGFAALLAGMVAPAGTVQPFVLPAGTEGETQPPGLGESFPVLPPALSGLTPVVATDAPAPTPGEAESNFGPLVESLVQVDPQAVSDTPVPVQTAPVAPEATPPAVEPIPVDTQLGTLPAEVEPPALPTPPKEADPLEPAQPEPDLPEPDLPEPDLPPQAVVPGNGNAFGLQRQARDGASPQNPGPNLGLEGAASGPKSPEEQSVDGPQADTFSLPPVTNQQAEPEVAPPSRSELPPSLAALQRDRHEPARLVEAISRAVNTTQEGNYTVTLRLHPESLGEVRLQLQLSGREVSTVMEVGNANARQQLESRGEQLRQSLTDAGLTLSGFSVSTGQNRQSPRERQQAFEEQFPDRRNGGLGRVQPVVNSPAGSIEQIRNAGRRTGRLDTMA